MLDVRNLTKSYSDNRVLEPISLTIEAGTFCTIVGASGCGKSTFLKLVLGQEKPSSGTLLLDRVPLGSEPGPDRGIVFQRYSVFPNLTVRQNMMLPADIAYGRLSGFCRGVPRQGAIARVTELLERCGLTAAANRYPAQLSGGMQQRVAIAQALMLEPRVLLLDEPFGALDPGIRGDMHALISQIWRDTGMTILMVTHDIREAFHLGTRLLVFDKVRHDPHDPGAYGATITYDLPLDDRLSYDVSTDPADGAVQATGTAHASIAGIVTLAADAGPETETRKQHIRSVVPSD